MGGSRIGGYHLYGIVRQRNGVLAEKSAGAVFVCHGGKIVSVPFCSGQADEKIACSRLFRVIFYSFDIAIPCKGAWDVFYKA